MHPDVARARSRKAVAHRRGDSEAIREAGRDLAAAKLEDYIRRTVESAPDLSDEQRSRLAALLAPRTVGGGRVA